MPNALSTTTDELESSAPMASSNGTSAASRPNLTDPFWTIHHVAAALGDLSIDAAREYSYREDFPAPKMPFSKNLWLREDILAWFTGLPAGRERKRRQHGKPLPGSRAQHRAGTTGTPVSAVAPKHSYTPRTRGPR